MPTSPDQVNRHCERARHERTDLDHVLDSGHATGTLSTVIDGKPWVVPMLYARFGDQILLHGSVGAGALRHVAAGAPAALCVMHLDGWVYAHTLFDSSANYRSAVVHSELVVLAGEQAAAALTHLSDRMLPGRSAEVPTHTRKQLAATQALAMNITEGQWTVKVRQGGPGEPADPTDVSPQLWTGVLPIRTVYGPPEAAPRVPMHVPTSDSVLELIATRPAV
jgi:nitroimidazol reductase NimA-like FMN-containing flavoprotein (pyridoxamine 5'-phosphate oxidase superfamily)